MAVFFIFLLTVIMDWLRSNTIFFIKNCFICEVKINQKSHRLNAEQSNSINSIVTICKISFRYYNLSYGIDIDATGYGGYLMARLITAAIPIIPQIHLPATKAQCLVKYLSAKEKPWLFLYLTWPVIFSTRTVDVRHH